MDIVASIIPNHYHKNPHCRREGNSKGKTTGFKNKHQICLETPAPTYWYSGRVFSSSLKWSMTLPPWKIAENLHSTLTLWSSANGSQMVMLESILSLLVTSDSLDRSPLGSSVHGILQAKILEWVAISSSRGYFWPRDCTPSSTIVVQYLYFKPRMSGSKCKSSGM